MFTIEEKPRTSGPFVGTSLGVDRRVVDLERGIWIQQVSGLVRRPGAVFKLVRPDAVIPFQVSEELMTGARAGEGFIRRQFESFGSSPTGQLHDKSLTPFFIRDSAEKDTWMRIAAEALLVFGVRYDGLNHPDGYIQVELHGETLTLKSFGYVT